MSDSYWDEQAVRGREQDAIDAMPSLDAAGARVGVSPRELQQLGEAGLIDVRPDRAGRPRVSLEQAELVVEIKSGRYERFADMGMSPIPREDR